MGTPASQALSSGAAASGSGSQPGSGAASPGAGGAAVPAAGGGAPGGAAQGFWSSWNLPEQKETRDWVANKAYADPFTLAKTARDLEREAATLRAGKGYPTPGADGKIDPNADKAWRALTGVPETADKYDIPLPENNPYPQFKGFMAEELLKAGVPAAMAPALARGYEAAVAKMETQLREQENTQSQEALLQLQSSWGSNYQERMAMAARGKDWIAKEAGGLDDMQLRTLEAVLTTPKFLTMMWKIGAGNAEARFAGGDNPGAFAGGASEAQARWNQIQADRAAGKISNLAWADMTKAGGEIPTLIERIANGNAPSQ
jgi:hypothetical protein